MVPYLALESNTPQSTKAFFERLRLSGYLACEDRPSLARKWHDM
ncbi:hypothetical protein LJR235_005067 [Pararhizobium sp. LjRoot235]